VLEVAQPKVISQYNYRILIPIHNPDHVEPLMDLAAPIAKAHNGEIVVLVVINVPRSLPVHEGMRFIHHKAPLMKKATQYGQKIGVPTRTAIRIAHRPSDGIITSAEKQKSSLILMGWKGYTSTRDRIFGEVADRVMKHAPCDLIAVKLMGAQPIEKILLPTAGGPHAFLASEYVALLKKAYNAQVTICNVIGKNHTEREKKLALQWIDKTIERSTLQGSVEKLVIESDHIATGVIKAAADYNLLVLGASREGLFSSVLVGEITEEVARYSNKPVMVVKRYEGVAKSIVKKVLG